MSGSTIALIVGILLVLLAAVLLVVLLRRRTVAQRWREEARATSGEARRVLSLVTQGLATLAQPAAAAQTWSDVDGRGAQLHSRLQGLAGDPPDQRAGAAVTRVDQTLQSLRASVEADRALRIGPPAPTDEQLSYSSAVVRERAVELQQALDELDDAVAAGG